jgi:hypothetical protein
MGKNAIHFDHHGRHHHHTAAMGPHSRQQSIQQSTNMICDRSTLLKLEKHIFLTNNMTIIARRVNDDDATTIASLAFLPPLQCCLACIPCIVMSLSAFPCLHPSSLSQCFLAHVPCVVRSLLPLPCLPCVVACWQ